MAPSSLWSSLGGLRIDPSTFGFPNQTYQDDASTQPLTTPVNHSTQSLTTIQNSQSAASHSDDITAYGKHDGQDTEQALEEISSEDGGLDFTKDSYQSQPAQNTGGVEHGQVPRYPIRPKPIRPRKRSLLQEIATSGAEKRISSRAFSESATAASKPIIQETLPEDPEQPLSEPQAHSYPETHKEMEFPRAPQRQEPNTNVARASSAMRSPVPSPLNTEIASLRGSDEVTLSPVSVGSSAMSESQNLSPSSVTTPRAASFGRMWDPEHRRNSVSRRISRRSSNKTRNPLQSPAGHFLSTWNRETSSQNAEPDDEGQTIGNYVIGPQINAGGFSVIKEVHAFVNGYRVDRAVKIVRKQVLGRAEEESQSLLAQLDHEILVWHNLHHPNILELLEVFSDDPFATFCIMEKHNGGSLFDLVQRYRRPSMTSVHNPNSLHFKSQVAEPTAKHEGVPIELSKRYLYQLASAVRYLHREAKVVHRDIKLENCLLTGSRDAQCVGGDSKLLLCDFGMADFISESDGHGHPAVQTDREDAETSPTKFGPAATSTNITGSLKYASPELINSDTPLREPAIDIWAFGVVAHAVLTARLPFTHSLEAKLLMMISRGEWDYSVFKDTVSQKDHSEGGDTEAAVQLAFYCMNTDVKRRWYIDDVMSCQFFKGCEELYGMKQS